jgi:hypothetical protein
MKKILYLVCIASLMLQSCASVIIGSTNKGNKPAVHVISASPTLPSDLTVNGKTDFESRLIYNGTEKNSPFFVHKIYLKKRLDSVAIQTGGKSYRSERLKSKRWFLLSGFWYFLEKIVDGHHFYSDVNLV